jgi:hypothetical protein
VQAWGINNKGWVAIASDAGNYVYCPSDKDCVATGSAFRRPLQKLHPLSP